MLLERQSEAEDSVVGKAVGGRGQCCLKSDDMISSRCRHEIESVAVSEDGNEKRVCLLPSGQNATGCT